MKEMAFLHQKMYLTTYLVSLGRPRNSFRQDIYDEEYVTEEGGGGGVYCHIYAVKVMVFKKFSLI